MEIFVSISIIVLCLAASTFFVYAIGALRRSEQWLAEVSRSVDAVSKDVASFNDNITPVLENLQAVTDTVRTVTSEIATQMNAFTNIVDVMNQFADDMRTFEQEIKSRVLDPVLDGAMYVRAVTRGIKTFLSVIRRD